MVPQLIARVDGLPVTLLDREVVWPIPNSTRPARCRAMSSKRRAQIERQTAVVHAAALPGWARALVAEQAAEQERLEIRSELVTGGAAVMRRGHNPLGWAATLLIAVAYAHVILEIAAAILAVAVGVRLLLISPVRHAIGSQRPPRVARPAAVHGGDRTPTGKRGAEQRSAAAEVGDGVMGRVRGPTVGLARLTHGRTKNEGDDMLQISISGELANEHPWFMAACAERGRQVEVFGDARSGEKMNTMPVATPSNSEASADRCNEPRTARWR